jgi:putative ABC transport system substrate-binding protein
MNRRAFVTGLGAVLVWPFAATGQVPTVSRIGVLVPVEPDDPKEPNIAAFRQTLRDLGYVDGQNIAVEYRYARGKAELYPALAKDLVRLRVDVMVVGSWHPTLEAKKATKTIPIVGVGMGSDPVAAGIVSSLARPGGNVTGSSYSTGREIWGKYVELLREAAPGTVRVAYLRDPRGLAQVPANTRTSVFAEAAAHALGLAFQMVEVPECRKQTTYWPG